MTLDQERQLEKIDRKIGIMIELLKLKVVQGYEPEIREKILMRFK